MSLTFARDDGRTVDLEPTELVIAGWTGRDAAAIAHHIEELAALDVPRPSTVPLYYRAAVTNLTQADTIDVLGADTSGEVEPVLLAMDDGLWLTVGSDHTDRKAEAIGVALSKQLCAKPLARACWRWDAIATDADRLLLRSFIEEGGARVPYQHGTLASIRPLAELMRGFAPHGLRPGTVMFCGTLAAIGGVRPAAAMQIELEDPLRGRSLRHAYRVRVLPVIA